MGFKNGFVISLFVSEGVSFGGVGWTSGVGIVYGRIAGKAAPMREEPDGAVVEVGSADWDSDEVVRGV